MPRPMSPSAVKRARERHEADDARRAQLHRDLAHDLRHRLQIPMSVTDEQLKAAVLAAIDDLDREREAATALACERELAGAGR